jgi:hypothetical protein
MKEELVVGVARSLEELAPLRAIWLDGQSDPEADFNYFKAQQEARTNSSLRPHVVTIRRGDDLVSILVGRVEKLCSSVAIGYFRIPLPPVKCLTVIAPGVIGESAPENVEIFFKSIKDTLRKGEVDVVYFHRLDPNSHLSGLVNGKGGLLSRDRFPILSEHWSANLPPSYPEFLLKLSSNQRHNFKRYPKRFKEKYGDQIRVERYRHLADIDRILKDTENVAQKTYQRGLSAGFANDEATKLRMRLYAESGQLRAYILYVGDTPVAFWNGFGFRDTFYAWTTGFDPAYGELRPGLFLLQELLIDLCEDKVLCRIDFGMGDAQYKREVCDVSTKEVSQFLFGPHARGMLMNLLRTPLIGFSRTSQSVLNKAGLTDRLKKVWRRQLTTKAS